MQNLQVQNKNLSNGGMTNFRNGCEKSRMDTRGEGSPPLGVGWSGDSDLSGGGGIHVLQPCLSLCSTAQLLSVQWRPFALISGFTTYKDLMSLALYLSEIQIHL